MFSKKDYENYAFLIQLNCRKYKEDNMNNKFYCATSVHFFKIQYKNAKFSKS